jgi:hypothetical protein
MVTCVLALALGVGVGRAQQTELLPPPKCCIEPTASAACAHEQGCCTDAVGCKQCTKPAKAKKAKCEGCSEWTIGFGCEACPAPAKKVKMSKHGTMPAPVMIAVPPPPPPMMAGPHGGPITIFSPSPMGSYEAPIMPPAAPPVPTMIFRASAAKGGESAVQHAKYVISGFKCPVALEFGAAKTTTTKSECGTGTLDIECAGQCRASCEKMTLHLAGGQEFTIATVGKQVVVTGPSLKATCDSLTRQGSAGCTCFLLDGHVCLHHSKEGTKTEMEGEHATLTFVDGHLHSLTIVTPAP